MRLITAFSTASLASFGIVTVIVAGCGTSQPAADMGDPGGNDRDGFSDTDATWLPGSCNGSPPRLSDIYRDILVPNYCTSPNCHGVSAAGGLNMSSPQLAYVQLVDQMPNGPDCKAPARALKGKPYESLIYQKVQPGFPVCGDKMPPMTKGLTPLEARTIECWIELGLAQ